jgi:GntR family transcriptional regulator
MFQIDRFGRQPIYEQIIDQVEQLVASGVLKPDDQLPSVRALSQTLSANPNTLQKAYAELERRGITTGVPGSGRFISKNAPRLVSEARETLLAEITVIGHKLQTAGIPKSRAIDALNEAYATSPPNTAAKTDAERPIKDDMPQGVSGKDAML